MTIGAISDLYQVQQMAQQQSLRISVGHRLAGVTSRQFSVLYFRAITHTLGLDTSDFSLFTRKSETEISLNLKLNMWLSQIKVGSM